jgi:hypothetical protein
MTFTQVNPPHRVLSLFLLIVEGTWELKGKVTGLSRGASDA